MCALSTGVSWNLSTLSQYFWPLNILFKFKWLFPSLRTLLSSQNFASPLHSCEAENLMNPRNGSANYSRAFQWMALLGLSMSPSSPANIPQKMPKEQCKPTSRKYTSKTHVLLTMTSLLLEGPFSIFTSITNVPTDWVCVKKKSSLTLLLLLYSTRLYLWQAKKEQKH